MKANCHELIRDALLRYGDLTHSELLRYSGVPDTRLNNALSQMKRKGIVSLSEPARGKIRRWYLLEDGTKGRVIRLTDTRHTTHAMPRELPHAHNWSL